VPCAFTKAASIPRATDVRRDAAAVVGVQRLYHHRPADPQRRLHRLLGRVDDLLAGHRQAEVAEDAVGLLLVGGDLDRDVAGLRGDGGLDPLLVAAVAELDQA
jgi:hypothetical protein